MFLAEALLLRTDLQKRQNDLKTRIRRCLVVQEGEEPPENPEELLERLKRLGSELARLVAAINYVNDTSSLETSLGTCTITQALARKEHLDKWIQFLRNVANESRTLDRYSKSEIRKVILVNPKKLQTDADELAQELRKLTTSLHQADWKSTMGDYVKPDDI